MSALPIDESGLFCGYASVFGAVDQGGDIMLPGAFRTSLSRRGAAEIRMLFQHDGADPIGVWDVVREDGYGLWVEGRLVGGVPRADALRRLIEKRAVDGMSIGFRTVRATREARSGYRRLQEVELWEISVVTFPMMQLARIATPPRSAKGLKQALTDAISVLTT